MNRSSSHRLSNDSHPYPTPPSHHTHTVSLSRTVALYQDASMADEVVDAQIDAIAARDDAGKAIISCLRVHKQLPMGLGSGASSALHKFKCLLQKVWFECQDQRWPRPRAPLSPSALCGTILHHIEAHSPQHLLTSKSEHEYSNHHQSKKCCPKFRSASLSLTTTHRPRIDHLVNAM